MFSGPGCVYWNNAWTTWGGSTLSLSDAQTPYTDEVLLHTNPEPGRYHVGVHASYFGNAWHRVPAYLTVEIDGIVVFTDEVSFGNNQEGSLWYGAVIDLPLDGARGGVYAGLPCTWGGCWTNGTYPDRDTTLEP